MCVSSGGAGGAGVLGCWAVGLRDPPTAAAGAFCRTQHERLARGGKQAWQQWGRGVRRGWHCAAAACMRFSHIKFPGPNIFAASLSPSACCLLRRVLPQVCAYTDAYSTPTPTPPPPPAPWLPATGSGGVPSSANTTISAANTASATPAYTHHHNVSGLGLAPLGSVGSGGLLAIPAAGGLTRASGVSAGTVGYGGASPPPPPPPPHLPGAHHSFNSYSSTPIRHNGRTPGGGGGSWATAGGGGSDAGTSGGSSNGGGTMAATVAAATAAGAAAASATTPTSSSRTGFRAAASASRRGGGATAAAGPGGLAEGAMGYGSSSTTNSSRMRATRFASEPPAPLAAANMPTGGPATAAAAAATAATAGSGAAGVSPSASPQPYRVRGVSVDSAAATAAATHAATSCGLAAQAAAAAAFGAASIDGGAAAGSSSNATVFAGSFAGTPGGTTAATAATAAGLQSGPCSNSVNNGCAGGGGGGGGAPAGSCVLQIEDWSRMVAALGVGAAAKHDMNKVRVRVHVSDPDNQRGCEGVGTCGKTAVSSCPCWRLSVRVLHCPGCSCPPVLLCAPYLCDHVSMCP